MKITDIARRLPDEIWSVFEPILPPVIWVGNGRKPCSNHSCLHGILYVLVSGIPWEMMPPCFPSYKTCQRRFSKWAQSECFLNAWRMLAEGYEFAYQNIAVDITRSDAGEDIGATRSL
jgi:transposase